LLALTVLGAGAFPARATESPSFTAYAQGQYMTARKLAETEAAQGSKEAYTLLGEIYEEGLGVAQDYQKAADAYRKGADLGDANAQFSLGTFALDGRGIKKDEYCSRPLREGARTVTPWRSTTLRSSISTAGATNRRRKPSNGCTRPQANLPRRNATLAAFISSAASPGSCKGGGMDGKAAEAGVPEAQVEYGVMLFKGEGVAIDEKRAARMFRLSAERGNPVAQNRLARLYANGVAVGPADPVQAAKWHLLARESGVADFTLDVMLAKLTPEQRAAADKAAQAWREEGLSN
jgi:TPR repeat protein